MCSLSLNAMDIAQPMQSEEKEEKKFNQNLKLESKKTLKSQTPKLTLYQNLINAIKSNNDDCAEFLISCGVKPWERVEHNVSAISLAAQMGNCFILNAIFNSIKFQNLSQDEKKQYENAIVTAVNSAIFTFLENPKEIEKFSNIIVLLLDYGADPSYVLVQLAYYHIPQLAPFVIKYIKKTSNINEKIDGKTILWLVSQDSEICKLLIANGACINAQNDDDGETILMKVAKLGNVDLLNFLIKLGADLDIQDKDGSTALILATKAYQVDIVKMLIQRGVITQLMDKSGKTALDYARMKAKLRKNNARYKQIIALLN